MKRYFQILVYAFAFVLFCVSANADTIHGYVKSKGRFVNGTVISGKRLQGVTISLKGGLSYISDVKGEFTIHVPAGDSIKFASVRKSGYILINDEVLTHHYSKQDGGIVIIMEDEAEFLADRLALEKRMRLYLRRKIREREDDIENLREQNKITQKQYVDMLEELYSARMNSEKLIKEIQTFYSNIDFEQMSEYQRVITRYIMNGELEKVDLLISQALKTLRNLRDMRIVYTVMVSDHCSE